MSDARANDPATDRAALREQTLAARARAEALVLELTALHNATDEQRPDPYKGVTGASSLENALAAAKRLLDSHERLLQELERE